MLNVLKYILWKNNNVFRPICNLNETKVPGLVVKSIPYNRACQNVVESEMGELTLEFVNIEIIRKWHIIHSPYYKF